MGAFSQPVARSINPSCLPGETPPITQRSLSVSHNERLAIECFATLPTLIAEAGVIPRLVFGVWFPRESGILGKNNLSK